MRKNGRKDKCYFNPRPPCGGRPVRACICAPGRQFQSTPPVRGATPGLAANNLHAGISIHAPRAGGDAISPPDIWRRPVFQSTPPVRGATGGCSDCRGAAQFQSTPPVRGATAKTAKRIRCSCKKLGKTDKYSLPFPLFPKNFLQFPSNAIIIRCEIPEVFCVLGLRT